MDHPEHFMSLNKDAISNNFPYQGNVINQGDCVKLINDQDLFQVIGIDDSHKKCWVRRWPLLTNGSPVFEIPTNQIVVPTN